jgi:DNA-binding CsgD family transcriptional regulator
MKAKTNTYKRFLSSIPGDSASALRQNASSIIDHFSPSKQVTFHFAPTTFLLDYSTKKYIHVDDSCFDMLGYKASYFLETGLEEYIGKWDPDDFYMIDTTVFPDNIAFLKSITPDEYSKYIFTYNYRLLTARGDYITVLQRFSYVGGTEQFPAGVIGVIFDITHYKTDATIIHTIERSSLEDTGIVNELVYKKVHPLLSRENKCLSKKEREVLKHMATGLASKEIGQKMELSVNTVNNHRRNMLAKTGCRCSSELINYAIRHGYFNSALA